MIIPENHQLPPHSNPKVQVVALLNELYRNHGQNYVYFVCDPGQILLGVKGPYNDLYIRELKRLVPSAARSWSPDDRAWFVRPSYFNIVEDLCKQCYSAGRIITHSNCLGLNILIPSNGLSIKEQPTTEELTKTAIRAVVKQLDDLEDKELVQAIIQAYKNKQVDGDKAIEMIDKLYS